MPSSQKSLNVSLHTTSQVPPGKKTSTTWATWPRLRSNLSSDVQRERSQDFSHKRIIILTSSLSPLMSSPTRLTGAHKELLQLLRIRAAAVHAGHSPQLKFLSHTQPSILDYSSIFHPNRSLLVLLTLISAVALATATVQLLRSLLTTLPKAKACWKSSSTLIPHTVAMKALVQYQLAKSQKFKFQASSSLLKTITLNCWTLLLKLVQLLFQLMPAHGQLTTVVSTMVATKLHPTLITLSFWLVMAQVTGSSATHGQPHGVKQVTLNYTVTTTKRQTAQLMSLLWMALLALVKLIP